MNIANIWAWMLTPPEKNYDQWKSFIFSFFKKKNNYVQCDPLFFILRKTDHKISHYTQVYTVWLYNVINSEAVT